MSLFNLCRSFSVDGGYSNWGTWGTCNTDCGEGVETKTRPCDNPPQAGTGADCSALGPGSEDRFCYPATCPGCDDLTCSGGNCTGFSLTGSFTFKTIDPESFFYIECVGECLNIRVILRYV